VSGKIRNTLLECLALKNLPRAGWVNAGVENPESVAAHSWGVAWLVAVLCPEEIDRGVATTIAVIHDVAEVRVGDITPADGIDSEEKSRMEYEAIVKILDALGGDESLLELWLDYENERTPEGRFVKACDKLDMALQASLYSEKYDLDLNVFVESALARLDDGVLRRLARG
jgi:putative hydrolase of HD superfamily